MFQLRHWMKGAIGVGGVTFLGQSIHQLGPTYGISIVLSLQLGCIFLFEPLGGTV
ncbi:hypothetical protein [Bacillus sp. NPDC093026]|uniref:hypothetical protein n=1 Tax=Bacillus sp. NPDC093026 TaxID=3363948 RepID=UPI00380BB122